MFLYRQRPEDWRIQHRVLQKHGGCHGRILQDSSVHKGCVCCCKEVIQLRFGGLSFNLILCRATAQEDWASMSLNTSGTTSRSGRLVLSPFWYIFLPFHWEQAVLRGRNILPSLSSLSLGYLFILRLWPFRHDRLGWAPTRLRGCRWESTESTSPVYRWMLLLIPPENVPYFHDHKAYLSLENSPKCTERPIVRSG